MRVLIAGSSGLIGSALVERLRAGGHEVTRLVRSDPGPGEHRWDPALGRLDPSAVEGHQAVVNLGGAGIGDHRWTDAHKAAVRTSRLAGTTLVAQTMASLSQPPEVLVSGSAIGFYGDRGDEELTEASGPGSGFLSDVVRQWEEAAEPAERAGIRVVRLRSGIVLSAQGGALKKQLLPFRMGLGGRLGSGQQYLSWVSIDDEVQAIEHILGNEELRGAVNVTAPTPVTNAVFTETLAKVLRRPAVLPVPTPALRALFGRQMTEEMLLAGQRVLPAALEASGYRFAHPDLEPALRHVLSKIA